MSCLSELHFFLLLPVISRLAARLVSSWRIGVARILILLSNRPLNLSTVAREREELRERERQRHGELKPGLHQSQQIILKAYYTKYQGLAFLRIAYAFKYARHCTWTRRTQWNEECACAHACALIFTPTANLPRIFQILFWSYFYVWSPIKPTKLRNTKILKFQRSKVY